MAHFAKVEEGIVANVIVIPDSQEDNGQDFISNALGLDGVWIQCSYNSFGGSHYDPETGLPSGKDHLRYNFPGVGYRYDESADAFYSQPPFPSWILNTNTYIWEPPFPPPTDQLIWTWDEDGQNWVEADPSLFPDVDPGYDVE
jgi:hypothetical protein